MDRTDKLLSRAAKTHCARRFFTASDFLIGSSVPPPVFEKLHAIFKEDEAVEQILSLRAIYSGPEEVVVMAKVRPSAKMNIEKLAQAMDDLDRKIRQALPVVADVFIDVTANRAREDSRTRLVNE
jgi:divalent metal cation (Fe/Co/Zn/Cd) transporter